MQHIEQLVREFEQGKISRRRLILSLAMASTATTLDPVSAQDRITVKAVGIHHVSYQAADVAKTRDFYSRVLGAKIAEGDGKELSVLTLGDVRFIIRRGATGQTPLVDHIGYSIENWNQGAVLAELKGQGLKPEPEGENSFQFKDPDGYHVQLNAKG
jgi:catechol 2,3-dioxygenase-like lactoylglutathione lyase family enzyme